MNKVIVIGLDGATFSIIEPLVERGKLPTIAKLMKGGVHGNLKSTIPPASIPAWQSFMTGKNPGAHGVFDFMKRTENEYYGSLTTSKDIKGRILWELISDASKKSIVIGVTGTYPPKPIRGIIISGMLTPDETVYTYPQELSKELQKDGYVKFVNPGKISDPDRLFRKLYVMEKKRSEVTISLMKKYDWDFLMVLFLGTDTIQHILWNMKEKIFEYYQMIDELIKQLLNNVDENTFTIIMSDHGFGELRKKFNTNKWLNDLGLLNYETVDIGSTRVAKLNRIRGIKNQYSYIKLMCKFGMTQENISQLARKSGAIKVKNYIPDFIKGKLQNLPTNENLGIDWYATKVFLSSFFGTETQSIMINLKGREPKGIVDPNEYDALRDYVIKNLKRLKDPETKENILDAVYKREELYHGSYVNDGPDIVMSLKGQYKASSNLKAESVVSLMKKIKGSHRLQGIFIAHGPDIKQNKKIEHAEIIDLAPTILHILDIPIPNDIDGKILKEIFKEDSDVVKRKVNYQEIDEQERIKHRIKKLKEFGKI